MDRSSFATLNDKVGNFEQSQLLLPKSLVKASQLETNNLSMYFEPHVIVMLLSALKSLDFHMQQGSRVPFSMCTN